MLPGKRRIIVISDSASTMTSDDWRKLSGSTDGTVDDRLYINHPPVDIILKEPEKREKDYWKPKRERFKKNN